MTFGYSLQTYMPYRLFLCLDPKLYFGVVILMPLKTQSASKTHSGQAKSREDIFARVADHKQVSQQQNQAETVQTTSQLLLIENIERDLENL